MRATQGFDAQEALLSPVQMHGGGRQDAVHEAAAAGIAGAGGALPHAAQIQRSFGGYDLSNVTAHTDGAAVQANAAMGADAYATGNHIAFGGAPDLHTTAHEAAHVVQQRAGVQLSGGVGAAGDAYEQHADRVADAVVAGQSAEPVLAEMAGGGGGSAVQRSARDGQHVQLKEGDETTETQTPADEVVAPAPLTDGEALTHARDVEIKFGAEAGGSQAARDGAQAMLDGCMAVVQAHVADYNAALDKGGKTEEEVAAEMLSTDTFLKEKMGTSPLNNQGKPNTGIAGAVGPEHVLNHIKTVEGGNVRTKMTAVFNFMSTLSDIALKAEKAKNDTFFESLGTRGALLKQAAADAKENYDNAVAEHEKKKAEGALEKKTISAVDAQKGVKGLGEITETEVTPSAHGPRMSILAPAPSVASQQGDARFNRPRDLNTGGGAAETRTADSASIGPGLHADEIAFMKLKADDLSSQYLTWAEGLNLYIMDSENAWVQRQLQLGLPVGAGPASGTTDRFMQIGQMLGCGATGTRAASLGYLLTINAHTLVEIMTSAAPYGSFTEPLDGYAMYRSIAPFGSLEKHANPRFWRERVVGTTPDVTTAPATENPHG